MISIIIPTYNRHETLIKVLMSIENQDYIDKEIIVIDDNSTDKGATRKVVEECKKIMRTNILYLNTHQDGYNLAMARNMGVIEAMGDTLLFLDDRYTLEPQTLEGVARTVKAGIWHYGKKIIKGEIIHKRPFIENFSWISKKDFRHFGCFNERINIYGGMSQDIRERWLDGYHTFRQEDVFCKQIIGSKSNHKKNEIWKAKLILKKLNGE